MGVGSVEFSNAAGSGLKATSGILSRGVGLVFSKVMRVRQVGDAVAGKSRRSETATILSDYQTHLAVTQGQYDVDVKKFHEELLRSGVIDAMIELAITDRSSRVVTHAFDTIFSRFLDPEENDKDRIFSEMMVAFRTSLAGMVSDPALLRFLQAFSGKINDRLDQVENSGSHLVPNTLPPNAEDIIQQLIGGLYSSYKNVKVETIGGMARDVPISDIYVPPSLRLVGSQKALKHMAEAVPQDIVRALSDEASVQYGRVDPVKSLTEYTYSEIRDSFRRVVVLGDPGGGKSTLCQRVCFDLARASRLSSQFSGRNHVSLDEQRVPFRIILRNFEQARSVDPQLDLLTFLVRDLKSYSSEPDDSIRSVVKYLLHSGRAAIAFDGLDEILDTANRRHYVDLVAAMCDQYPLCPVLVTSRFVGYESAPLPKDFDKIALLKFDDDEVKDYAHRFMVHIGDKTDNEAEIESVRFLAQTRDNARDLRKNPLMLGLMLWIFLVKRDVPSNRPAIYAECSNLMFDKWDSNRGIRPKLPKFDRAQLFSNIASLVYPDRMLRAGVSKDWLISQLNQYFSSKFVNASDAEEASCSLADFLVGRAWVMMESGEGVFAFTHQTFMEYFYSRHVVNQHDTVKSLFRLVRTNIAKKERDVVNHLSMQVKTNGNDRLQREAIDEILSYRKKLSKPESIYTVLQFLAKSLEYLVPSEAYVRIVIEELYNFTLEENVKSDVGLISLAISSCNLAREFVESEIIRLITADVRGDDQVRAEKAVHFLIIAAKGRWSANSSENYIPVESIVSEIRDHIIDMAESRPFWAHAAWSLFAYTRADWLRRYGMQSYAQHELVTGFEYVSSMDALVLGFQAHYKERYQRGTIDGKSLRQALILMGDVGFSAEQLAPVYLSRAKYHLELPLDIWRSAFELLLDKPDEFRGVYFLWNSLRGTTDLSRMPDSTNELSTIDTLADKFLRQHGDWPGITPAFKDALTQRTVSQKD
jgi:hypothetical protein